MNEEYIEILKQINPLPDMCSCKSALFIGPHPDDIEIGAGGTAAMLAAQGCQVTFLVMTNGSCGTSVIGAVPEETASLRRAEAEAGAKCLGAKKVIVLDFFDNGFFNEDEMALELAKIIMDVRPELLVSIDPMLPNETHIDHILVPRLLPKALCWASNTNACVKLGLDPHRVWGIKEKDGVKCIAYYFTHRPNTYIDVGEHWEKKLESMALHESQLGANKQSGERMQWDAITGYLQLRCGYFGSISGCDLAEGFYVFGPNHAHCFPEIDFY